MTKCFVCGKEGFLLPDDICEGCAIANHRNVLAYQEMGMDFKEAQEKSIRNMKERYGNA